MNVICSFCQYDIEIDSSDGLELDGEQIWEKCKGHCPICGKKYLVEFTYSVTNTIVEEVGPN